VQRHRATRLHYDFRLEIDGVLVSWAVPRGPSLDPRQRRLAVHVEDHPLGYYSFEGVIPRGEYGGGDVIVWDWGRWTADDSITDASKAVRDGELKFRLDGKKLQGKFVILRMAWREGRKDQWLLFHRRDDEAVPGWDAEDYPESVKTGRTNDQVAARRRRKRA
jgi:bifunctional non-homologous end joining protein LigD